MNKQVELLAVQAGFNIHNDVIDGQNFNHEIQKLAELIVAECADFAHEHNDYSEGTGLGVGRARLGRALKQHFGVEE